MKEEINRIISIAEKIESAPDYAHEMVKNIGIGKYAALECVVESNDFRELIRENPLLTQIVVYKLYDKENYLDKITEMVKKRPKDILKLLPGRKNEDDVLFLKKFCGKIDTREDLAAALYAFRSPGFRKFCSGLNLAFWNYDIYWLYLNMYNVSEDFMNGKLFRKLIEEYSENLNNDDKYNEISRVIEMTRPFIFCFSYFTSSKIAATLIRDAASIEQFEDLHYNNMAQGFSVRGRIASDETILYYEFPPPPFEDSKHIKYIPSNNRLFQIADKYGIIPVYRNLFEGGFYFYKYKKDVDRAVIVLKRDSEDNINIEEILTPQKDEPLPGVINDVSKWLSAMC